MFPVEPVVGRNTISCNDPSIAGMGESEARVERMRRNNRLKMVQSELQRDQQLQQAAESAMRTRRAAEREAAIADEMQRHKAAVLKEQKTIQRVREESDEIRTLEQKLLAAKVNKIRAEQMSEAQRLAAEAKQARLMEGGGAEQRRREEEEHAAEEARVKMEIRQRAAEELERQNRDREEQRLAAYKQFLREKNEIDNLVDRVRAEEQAERDARMESQKQTQAFISAFREEQDMLKQAESDRQKEEDRKIVEYMKLQSARQEENKRKAQEKQAEVERVFKAQSEQIQKERQEKEERERLLNQYYEEQRAEASRLDEEQRQERQRRIRRELKEFNEMQARILHARREKEKAEEAQLRRDMLSQFAESERIERQSAVERQRAKAAHAREVERLIEEKRALRESERQRELYENKMTEEAAAAKADMVKQERLRLLREQGLDLIGYLPPGTILPGDLEALGLSAMEIANLERQMKEAARANSAPSSFR